MRSSILLTRSVCLLVFTVAWAHDKHHEPPVPITIRLFTAVRVEPHLVQQVIKEASWIFRTANLLATWSVCDPDVVFRAPGDPCRDSSQSFAVTLTDRIPEFVPATCLGFALVSSGDRNHAAVFFTRVTELARSYSAEVNDILSYAVVHELAHLFLGSAVHNPKGILRGGFSKEDARAVGQRSLVFSKGEAAEMQRRLSQRQSNTPSCCPHKSASPFRPEFPHSSVEAVEATNRNEGVVLR